MLTDDDALTDDDIPPLSDDEQAELTAWCTVKYRETGQRGVLLYRPPTQEHTAVHKYYTLEDLKRLLNWVQEHDPEKSAIVLLVHPKTVETIQIKRQPLQ